jgi:hypothetical protein
VTKTHEGTAYELSITPYPTDTVLPQRAYGTIHHKYLSVVYTKDQEFYKLGYIIFKKFGRLFFPAFPWS